MEPVFKTSHVGCKYCEIFIFIWLDELDQQLGRSLNTFSGCVIFNN